MKKIITSIIAFMALALPITALESSGKSSSTPIALNIPPIKNKPNPTIHRAPMRIPVEAWYDADTDTISIKRIFTYKMTSLPSICSYSELYY